MIYKAKRTNLELIARHFSSVFENVKRVRLEIGGEDKCGWGERGRSLIERGGGPRVVIRSRAVGGNAIINIKNLKSRLWG